MGMIPNICKHLFEEIKIKIANSEATTLCYKTSISYMEIYNEKLRDLLITTTATTTTDQATSLNSEPRIREHPTKGIFVQNLNQFNVTDLENTLNYLTKGNENRSTASTHIHDKSSRSHAIFTITFIQAKVVDGIPIEIKSKLNLVDLAGSERASDDLIYNKKQLKEGANINKSLVSLGNVISILANTNNNNNLNNKLILTKKSNSITSISGGSLSSDFNMSQELFNIQDETTSITKQNNNMTTFVPYRDSMLTYFLKDSLGGNSKTHIIASKY
jgi:hypothetical protein